jgi:predicted HTH domain antitoxin
VKPALATALFRDGALSLPRAAALAGMAVSAFATHLSRLGIAVVQLAAQEAARDMETLDAWLAASS